MANDKFRKMKTKHKSKPQPANSWEAHAPRDRKSNKRPENWRDQKNSD